MISIQKIAEATDRNDHWGAAIQIAQEFGCTAEIELLEEYKSLNELNGFSTEGEISVRTAILKVMVSRAGDQADLIRSAL